MKNLAKVGITGLIIAQMLVVLTGCGEKDKNTNTDTDTNEKGNANEVRIENNIEKNQLQNKTDYTENSNKIENSNQVEKVEENKIAENATNKQEEKIAKTEKEIVKELFEKELEKTNPKLKEYKVTEVEILTGEDRKTVEGFFKQDVSAEGIKIKDKDIFAEVTYSVRPEDINNSEWIAGNGVVEGNWIKNKFSCVVVVEKDGSYEMVSSGTGW